MFLSRNKKNNVYPCFVMCDLSRVTSFIILQFTTSQLHITTKDVNYIVFCYVVVVVVVVLFCFRFSLF